MQREEVRARTEEIAASPAIRVSSAQNASSGAEAISGSAVPIADLTMTRPGDRVVSNALVLQNTVEQ